VTAGARHPSPGYFLGLRPVVGLYRRPARSAQGRRFNWPEWWRIPGINIMALIGHGVTRIL
jgi:hypothetical protein